MNLLHHRLGKILILILLLSSASLPARKKLGYPSGTKTVAKNQISTQKSNPIYINDDDDESNSILRKHIKLVGSIVVVFITSLVYLIYKGIKRKLDKLDENTNPKNDDVINSDSTIKPSTEVENNNVVDNIDSNLEESEEPSSSEESESSSSSEKESDDDEKKLEKLLEALISTSENPKYKKRSPKKEIEKTLKNFKEKLEIDEIKSVITEKMLRNELENKTFLDWVIQKKYFDVFITIQKELEMEPDDYKTHLPDIIRALIEQEKDQPTKAKNDSPLLTLFKNILPEIQGDFESIMETEDNVNILESAVLNRAEKLFDLLNEDSILFSDFEKDSAILQAAIKSYRTDTNENKPISFNILKKIVENNPNIKDLTKEIIDQVLNQPKKEDEENQDNIDINSFEEKILEIYSEKEKQEYIKQLEEAGVDYFIKNENSNFISLIESISKLKKITANDFMSILNKKQDKITNNLQGATILSQLIFNKDKNVIDKIHKVLIALNGNFVFDLDTIDAIINVFNKEENLKISDAENSKLNTIIEILDILKEPFIEKLLSNEITYNNVKNIFSSPSTKIFDLLSKDNKLRKKFFHLENVFKDIYNNYLSSYRNNQSSTQTKNHKKKFTEIMPEQLAISKDKISSEIKNLLDNPVELLRTAEEDSIPQFPEFNVPFFERFKKIILAPEPDSPEAKFNKIINQVVNQNKNLDQNIQTIVNSIDQKKLEKKCLKEKYKDQDNLIKYIIFKNKKADLLSVLADELNLTSNSLFTLSDDEKKEIIKSAASSKDNESSEVKIFKTLLPIPSIKNCLNDLIKVTKYQKNELAIQEEGESEVKDDSEDNYGKQNSLTLFEKIIKNKVVTVFESYLENTSVQKEVKSRSMAILNELITQYIKQPNQATFKMTQIILNLYQASNLSPITVDFLKGFVKQILLKNGTKRMKYFECILKKVNFTELYKVYGVVNLHVNNQELSYESLFKTYSQNESTKQVWKKIAEEYTNQVVTYLKPKLEKLKTENALSNYINDSVPSTNLTHQDLLSLPVIGELLNELSSNKVVVTQLKTMALGKEEEVPQVLNEGGEEGEGGENSKILFEEMVKQFISTNKQNNELDTVSILSLEQAIQSFKDQSLKNKIQTFYQNTIDEDNNLLSDKKILIKNKINELLG